MRPRCAVQSSHRLAGPAGRSLGLRDRALVFTPGRARNLRQDLRDGTSRGYPGHRFAAASCSGDKPRSVTVNTVRQSDAYVAGGATAGDAGFLSGRGAAGAGVWRARTLRGPSSGPAAPASASYDPVLGTTQCQCLPAVQSALLRRHGGPTCSRRPVRRCRPAGHRPRGQIRNVRPVRRSYRPSSSASLRTAGRWPDERFASTLPSEGRNPYDRTSNTVREPGRHR
jgi:hypothetical protein